MNLKSFVVDDEAVSPVIGVILMVAITVILAAVIGTFVLGLGDQVQDTAPQASFSFDFVDTDDGDDPDDSLDITHDGGDRITAAQVDVVVSGASPSGADGSYQWDGAALGGTTEVFAGKTVTADASAIGADTNGDTDPDLDLNPATVRVTWEGQDGGKTATLGKWEGPDA